MKGSFKRLVAVFLFLGLIPGALPATGIDRYSSKETSEIMGALRVAAARKKPADGTIPVTVGEITDAANRNKARSREWTIPKVAQVLNHPQIGENLTDENLRRAGDRKPPIAFDREEVRKILSAKVEAPRRGMVGNDSKTLEELYPEFVASSDPRAWRRSLAKRGSGIPHDLRDALEVLHLAYLASDRAGGTAGFASREISKIAPEGRFKNPNEVKRVLAAEKTRITRLWLSERFFKDGKPPLIQTEAPDEDLETIRAFQRAGRKKVTTEAGVVLVSNEELDGEYPNLSLKKVRRKTVTPGFFDGLGQLNHGLHELGLSTYRKTGEKGAPMKAPSFTRRWSGPPVENRKGGRRFEAWVELPKDQKTQLFEESLRVKSHTDWNQNLRKFSPKLAPELRDKLEVVFLHLQAAHRTGFSGNTPEEIGGYIQTRWHDRDELLKILPDAEYKEITSFWNSGLSRKGRPLLVWFELLPEDVGLLREIQRIAAEKKKKPKGNVLDVNEKDLVQFWNRKGMSPKMLSPALADERIQAAISRLNEVFRKCKLPAIRIKTGPASGNPSARRLCCRGVGNRDLKIPANSMILKAFREEYLARGDHLRVFPNDRHELLMEVQTNGIKILPGATTIEGNPPRILSVLNAQNGQIYLFALLQEAANARLLHEEIRVKKIPTVASRIDAEGEKTAERWYDHLVSGGKDVSLIAKRFYYEVQKRGRTLNDFLGESPEIPSKPPAERGPPPPKAERLGKGMIPFSIAVAVRRAVETGNLELGAKNLLDPGVQAGNVVFGLSIAGEHRWIDRTVRPGPANWFLKHGLALGLTMELFGLTQELLKNPEQAEEILKQHWTAENDTQVAISVLSFMASQTLVEQAFRAVGQDRAASWFGPTANLGKRTVAVSLVFLVAAWLERAARLPVREWFFGREFNQAQEDLLNSIGSRDADQISEKILLLHKRFSQGRDLIVAPYTEEFLEHMELRSLRVQQAHQAAGVLMAYPVSRLQFNWVDAWRRARSDAVSRTRGTRYASSLPDPQWGADALGRWNEPHPPGPWEQELLDAEEAAQMAADLLVQESVGNLGRWSEANLELTPPSWDRREPMDLSASKNWKEIRTLLSLTPQEENCLEALGRWTREEMVQAIQWTLLRRMGVYGRHPLVDEDSRLPGKLCDAKDRAPEACGELPPGTPPIFRSHLDDLLPVAFLFDRLEEELEAFDTPFLERTQELRESLIGNSDSLPRPHDADWRTLRFVAKLKRLQEIPDTLEEGFKREREYWEIFRGLLREKLNLPPLLEPLEERINQVLDQLEVERVIRITTLSAPRIAGAS